ncbi:hypothetical protein DQ04_09341000 [Trypanosoma grayi]|uniref:hypothetical protein n=1 Tax=Trypanosoma grayi TaxID=71804 RepID=UPI0004F488E1|nr:hypothetical protein DQ04_09341000 [Trypanosoma grayi]KEG07587.1 hypothetical protein DQ04_09341000 [Trypanosoma grayi]
MPPKGSAVKDHHKPPDVAAAVSVSDAYESLLRRLPRPVLYGAIQLTSPEAILALVPPEMVAGKVVQSKFHVTTIFLHNGVCPDKAMMVRLGELLGTSIQLTLTQVVSDPKGTAIVVRNEGEFPCANARPHITVANARGVPAKYSNELLNASHAKDRNRSVVNLPAGTCVTGEFAFVFK